MKNKILIIGGTGFIGTNLSLYCLKNNWKITVLSRKKPIKKIKRINYIIADISKIKDLKKKIKPNYDYIINLGGNINHSSHNQTYLTHFVGLKNILEVVKNFNLVKFLQIGSSLEYGGNKSPHNEKMKINQKKLKSNYSKAKFLSTQFLLKNQKKFKFNFTIIRLYQVYGPHQKFDRLIPFVIKSCLLNKRFPCSAGSQLRDFVYIDDVMRGIILLLKSKKGNNQIVNLGFGRPIKVINVIKKIKKNINLGELDIGKIPIRKDESLVSYPNIKKIYKLVGWKPKIGLLTGLKYTINHYKKEI
tara:strand:- start:1953 stop:2858 length:906 start_codon:yes stop_codon:yes gene_type:complete